MNKISLAIISTFIITLIVLIAQPQMPQNIKFTNADFGYNSTSSIQDTKTNINNINNIKDTNAKIKDVSTINNIDANIRNNENVSNKDISLQNVDRNAYMEKLRLRAQHQLENEQIDERIAEQNLIRASYMNRLKKEREDSVREQVQNEIETRKAEEKARIEAKIISSQVNNHTTNTNNDSKKLKEGEDEDLIDWSIWHTNVANSILRNTSTQNTEKSAGSKYIISFNVDRNRKITNVNIQVIYTPKGANPEPYRNAIKRAIAQINGSNILIFPSRTKRTVTKFKTGIGVLEVKKNTKINPYANPSWFPDKEVNKRKYSYYE